MRHFFSKRRIALLCALALTLTLASCARREPIAESTTPSQTETETTTVHEAHKQDHRFHLGGVGEVFVPSLWVRHGSVKSSVLLNSATWKPGVPGEESALVSGRQPLLSGDRLDPIAQPDAPHTLTLEFSGQAEKIVIRRWNAEYIGNGDQSENFESVPLSDSAFSAQANSLYEITASFGDIQATYLLYVRQ